MMVDWTRIVDSSGNGAASDSGNIWGVNGQSLVWIGYEKRGN